MDNIYLIGAEEVGRAASRMSTAADSMLQAATNIQGSVEHLERILTTFTQDLASIMHRLEEVQRMMSIPIEPAPTYEEPQESPQEFCGWTLPDGGLCQKPDGTICGTNCKGMPF